MWVGIEVGSDEGRDVGRDAGRCGVRDGSRRRAGVRVGVGMQVTTWDKDSTSLQCLQDGVSGRCMERYWRGTRAQSNEWAWSQLLST